MKEGLTTSELGHSRWLETSPCAIWLLLHSTLSLSSVQALEPDYAALAEHMAGSEVRIAKYQADVDREFANASLGLKTFPSIVYYPKVR